VKRALSRTLLSKTHYCYVCKSFVVVALIQSSPPRVRKTMAGSRLRHRFVIENLGAGDGRSQVFHSSSFQTATASDDYCITTTKDYYTLAPTSSTNLLSPAWQPHTTVSDKIPGLRTSAGMLSPFLSILCSWRSQTDVSDRTRAACNLRRRCSRPLKRSHENMTMPID